MPTYKVSYFDGQGKAETVRMCLAVGGIEFEDHRFKDEDWPALKPSTPWGVVPVLYIDGKAYGESLAQGRLAASRAGLAPSSDLDQALVDSVVYTVSAVQDKFYNAAFHPPEGTKPKMMEELAGHVKKCTAALEKFLTANNGGNGFFVGDKLTWADLQFFNFIDVYMLETDTDGLESSPKLKALWARIKAEPRVAAYLAKRPASDW